MPCNVLIATYIGKYYYTNINLNELSDKYHLNISYLSQLFKSEIGKNFTEYLTGVRINKAKELLSNTSLKAYEVAKMVGYSNFRYFSDIFSRLEGCTPSEFRQLPRERA